CAQLKPERLDKGKATASRPHCFGNYSSDRNITGAQIDVESNQEWSRPDCNSSCRFVNSKRSQIRGTIRIHGNLFTQQFQRPAPDIFKINPLWFQCGTLIEIDRNRKLTGD